MKKPIEKIEPQIFDTEGDRASAIIRKLNEIIDYLFPEEGGENQEPCGKIVSSGSGKIDGHACFNRKPCPIHDSLKPSEVETLSAKLHDIYQQGREDMKAEIELTEINP